MDEAELAGSPRPGPARGVGRGVLGGLVTHPAWEEALLCAYLSTLLLSLRTTAVAHDKSLTESRLPSSRPPP